MGAPMGAQKRRRHAPSTKRKPYQEAHHSHSYSQKKKRRNSRLSSPSQTPGEQRRDGFVTCDGRFDFLEALIRQPGESPCRQEEEEEEKASMAARRRTTLRRPSASTRTLCPILRRRSPPLLR
jgi:hypothetical protein